MQESKQEVGVQVSKQEVGVQESKKEVGVKESKQEVGVQESKQEVTKVVREILSSVNRHISKMKYKFLRLFNIYDSMEIQMAN